MTDSQDFRDRLSNLPGLDESTIQAIVRFREVLLKENAVQNLTRITAPADFVDGNVIDCIELNKSGLVSYPAMDLGSGGGIPGLLLAAMGTKGWLLCDSEGSKAAFLARAIDELGLQGAAQAVSGRAEDALKDRKVESVVARAVGKVEKVFGWLERCSTWNNLVLLKGPGWEEEWAEFQKSRHRKKLRIAAEHRYEVGPEKKKRVIVRLERT